MQIDITSWVERFGDEAERFSDSIARSGLQNIAQITWAYAVAAADETMFVTDATRDELVDHFLGYGAWDRDKLEAHTDEELNALLLQFIAGDYQARRDAEDEDRLEEYEENEGGRLYRAESGQWFYYIGN